MHFLHSPRIHGGAARRQNATNKPAAQLQAQSSSLGSGPACRRCPSLRCVLQLRRRDRCSRHGLLCPDSSPASKHSKTKSLAACHRAWDPVQLRWFTDAPWAGVERERQWRQVAVGGMRGVAGTAVGKIHWRRRARPQWQRGLLVLVRVGQGSNGESSVRVGGWCSRKNAPQSATSVLSNRLPRIGLGLGFGSRVVRANGRHGIFSCVSQQPTSRGGGGIHGRAPATGPCLGRAAASTAAASCCQGRRGAPRCWRRARIVLPCWRACQLRERARRLLTAAARRRGAAAPLPL